MARPRPNRTGFTLIELLIVILIIGALVAILVPTVFAAFRRAKEAQVTAELNNLATAIASFKNAFGENPPSRIILCESGFSSLPAAFLNATVGSQAAIAAIPSPTPVELPLGANCTDMTNQQLVQRSLLALRRFWPRADFVNPPTANQISLYQFNDFDGDGRINPYPIVLSGSECLAFFLGGLPIHGTSGITGMSGFNKSPIYPFISSFVKVNGNPVAPNRSVPNYEFNNGRLIDQDGDGIPSYIDPINVVPGSRVPYAYFVSYGVNGYDPNDVNGFGHIADPIYELEEQTTAAPPPIVERGFLVNFPVYDGASPPNQQNPSVCVSPSPNPYTSGLSGTGNVSWFNPTSFQLLCAGHDGMWGLGGTYSASGTGAGRLPILPGDIGIFNGDTTSLREQREADNLTNFSGGRLD